MHAVLLDRYQQKELTDEWKRRGALVFEDLVDIVDFLGWCKTQLGWTTRPRRLSSIPDGCKVDVVLALIATGRVHGRVEALWGACL
jgi:hypothetical protein